MLSDVLLEFRLAAPVRVDRPHFLAALHDSEYNLFDARAGATDLLGAFFLVHIAGLAADESFIDFNFSAKLSAESFILHCKPNPLELPVTTATFFEDIERDFSRTTLVFMRSQVCNSTLDTRT